MRHRGRNRLDWLLALRAYYGTYHNHKEWMAYAATTLFSVSVVSAAATMPFNDAGVAAIAVGVITGIVLLFVLWQLRLRIEAAGRIDGIDCELRKMPGLGPVPGAAKRWWKKPLIPSVLSLFLVAVAGSWASIEFWTSRD